jgi:hypothetical protein
MVLSRCMTMIPSIAASTAPSSWTKPCCLSMIVKYMYHGSYLISPQILPQNDWISAADINNATRKNTQEDTCDKEQKQAFQSFGHLPNELKLYVHGFVAEVSMDSSDETAAMYSLYSTLTSVFPLMYWEFNSLSKSDYPWQATLESLVEKEPVLWREGLFETMWWLHSTTRLIAKRVCSVCIY